MCVTFVHLDSGRSRWDRVIIGHDRSEPRGRQSVEVWADGSMSVGGWPGRPEWAHFEPWSVAHEVCSPGHLDYYGGPAQAWGILPRSEPAPAAGCCAG